MKRTITAVLVALAVPSVAQAQSLTVYSGLPLSGFPAANTKAINTGARLALEQSGNASVRLVTLNDGVTGGLAAANAKTAAQDASTIAYIGDYYSAATRVALPVLNQAGVAMVSPSSTYKGLTVDGPGTRPGEPALYYPTPTRSFFRIVPNDAVQAAAIVTAMRDKRCTKIAVRRDGEPYGRGLAADIRSTAARLGLPVVGLKKATCLVFAGTSVSDATNTFRTAPKQLKLFGGDGIGTADFAAQLPRAIAKRTFVTADVLSPGSYGLPAHSNPYQAFGYEAMKVILDGIAAGATTRDALIAWLHTVQNRPSAFGAYGFDATGDTTLRTIGLYRISNYALRFVGPITAA